MNWSQIESELEFTTSRSSGKGGQHVNKTETRVQVFFNIDVSVGLQEHEKEKIHEKLQSKISQDGILQVQDQSSRSQIKNKQNAVKRLRAELEKALKKQVKRIPTKKSKQANEQRLKEKRLHSEKKKWRSNKDF